MSECTKGGIHKWAIGESSGKLFCVKCGDYQEDNINAPEHYHKNGIDVIGFSEMQFPKEELKGFYRINCLKYITRFDRKGGLEDLKKASFYLNKLLEMENGHEKA